MAATLNDSVTIPEGVMLRELDRESVILNLGTGIYFGLDEVGTTVWRLLTEHRSLRPVYELMLPRYEVAPDMLERDLLRLVEELRQKALLHVRAEP